MILTYEFKNGEYLEEEHGNVKFWKGFGLHDFEGDWEGFADCFPELIDILLENGTVKITSRN